jgi:membrane associated rhomboid family serine protease
LWLLSGLGGNFFSALFEDKCTLVVGASGAVFGMVGLFVGDFMLNFETIKRWVSIAHVVIQFCNTKDSASG